MTLLASATAHADYTATDAFVRMPRALMPLLPHSQRLDMVDYFNSGFADHREANSLGGSAGVTAISATQLTVQLTAVSRMELTLLPCKNDTIIAVVETIDTPTPDSSVRFFNARWQPMELLSEPAVADWLTADGRKRAAEVAQTVPFMLASAEFSADGTRLTFTNNVAQWVGKESYNAVADCLRQTLTYTWNGRKFQLSKQ
jgi:hypothetical protein